MNKFPALAVILNTNTPFVKLIELVCMRFIFNRLQKCVRTESAIWGKSNGFIYFCRVVSNFSKWILYMSEISYTLYFIIFDICELTRSKYLQYAHNQKLLFIGIFSVEFCLVDGLFLSDFFSLPLIPTEYIFFAYSISLHWICRSNYIKCA